MKYVYILSGWEGSTADSRVLRDAVTRPNGFKVPIGKYYLCDCGYTNGDGFLAPYRGVRYHVDEWGAGSLAPQNFRTAMQVDPLEQQIPEFYQQHGVNDGHDEFLEVVESSQQWTSMRDNLAMSMYNEWSARR
ncbi:hypothetical protein DH2020_046414 [Rehmannia glutinosa]|uniref:DDE Tnp4 domain-containing protein n=1 Tax=Rehmannia glutinosa TaxID=99300 RepID=A0ABR0UBI7_REHGL